MVVLPEEYHWSSYRIYRYAREAQNAPAWLEWETVLSEHSSNTRNARRAYQRFVEQGIHDPPAAAVGGVFLGKSAWVEAMRERLAGETTCLAPLRGGDRAGSSAALSGPILGLLPAATPPK